ncbi:uncharacterized protein GIQ15_04514 [Arthroderma uncinatum]|uniref:uncharacterized protein n=1 Tax=Arthroderma uncinatum TaxID=74035 RepID=UPI00144AE00F|nr:uncharacterized protein GIQ15_04514 [Arthroderma uncinatum]KAF3481755.1 hypothetical protein GIQ15_04514 [Arthroderma uncinatum]
MRFDVSKIIPLLAAIASLEPFAAARTIPGGKLGDIKRSCDVEPCDAGPNLPKGPHELIAGLRVRRPPIIPRPPSPSGGKSGGGKPGGNPNEPHPGQQGAHGPGENRPPPTPQEPSPPVLHSRPKDGSFDERRIPGASEDLGYEGYGRKGAEVRKILDDAISDKRPDVDRPPLDYYYNTLKIRSDIRIPVSKMRERLGAIEEEPSTFIAVLNKEDLFTQVKSNYRQIHEGYYSPEKNFVHISKSFSRNDFLPDSVRLPYSDMIYQGIKVTGGRPRDFKYISQTAITNMETRATIRTAREKLKISEREEHIFRPSKPGSDEDNAFNSLAGTENAKSTFRMLADHRAEFGDLKVVGIHTYDIDDALLIELGHLN